MEMEVLTSDSAATTTSRSKRSKLSAALSMILMALMLFGSLGAAPASAHNDPHTGKAPSVYTGLAGHKWNDNGTLKMKVKDIKTDGHCVVARAHVGGSWKQLARSCGSLDTGSIRVNDGNRWTKVNVSYCIEGHIGKTNGCAYQTIWVG